MELSAFLLQVLNGLDKGSAYALIALGLTLIFGTLGVVNFAHGALFMIGAFCAVTLQKILSLSVITIDETKTDFLGKPLKVKTPYVEQWFGQATGELIIDWAVPLAIIFAIPIMMLLGFIMERGLIKYFYKRPHADQILVTFGLAIVLQEIIVRYCCGCGWSGRRDVHADQLAQLSYGDGFSSDLICCCGGRRYGVPGRCCTGRFHPWHTRELCFDA